MKSAPWLIYKVIFAALAMIWGMVVSSQAVEITEPADDEMHEEALSHRIRLEAETREDEWVITPMRPTYVMPVTYVSKINKKPWEEASEDEKEYDHTEVKFQISFKFVVWEDVWSPKSDLYVGYSQVSVWQAYNSEESEAFRDTNYEPELILSVDTDNEIFGFKNPVIMFGAVHQSNGRGSDSLSRSWNRVYANVLLERGNFALSLKPWYRIPENDEDDENKNIEKYYGYGEIRAAYKAGDYVLSAMGRNNLRAEDNKGALELNWSFPMGRMRGFIQYFTGYGETLLDYDFYEQRVGIGVMLSDVL